MSAEPTVISEQTSGEETVIPDSTTTSQSTQSTQSTDTGNWRDSLSADLRNNPTLVNIPDIESLAKEHVNVQKMIGADRIVMPGEDATPEDMSAFYTKLGRPEKVEDYDLSSIEIPEGLPWDGEFQNSMISRMHELGLNQKQVQGMLGAYVETVGSQFEQATGDMQRTRETGISDLRNAWGRSYEAQVDLAKRAFIAGAGDNFEQVAGLKMADGGMVGDHPDIIRAFAALGGKMSEHGLVGATATRTTLSPAEAKSQANKLLGDPEFLKAYTQREHIEHDAAVKRITDLTIAQVGEDPT